VMLHQSLGLHPGPSRQQDRMPASMTELSGQCQKARPEQTPGSGRNDLDT